MRGMRLKTELHNVESNILHLPPSPLRKDASDPTAEHLEAGRPGSDIVVIPCGVLDFSQHVVRYYDGDKRPLSRMELSLLRYLVDRANTTVSRAQLLRDVWHCNPDVVTTRTVDMHVAMVRKKLRDDARDPSVLLTVSGRGYLFRSRPGPVRADDPLTWRMTG